MFLMFGATFLLLLSLTLLMLWAHERITNKRIVPRARIEECWTGDERRRHTRFEDELSVSYSVEKKPHLRNSRTINLSKGGMKLFLDDKLQKGAILDLKIYIPQKKVTVEVEAEVVWTKDAQDNDLSGKRFFHSGVKFIAMKGSSDAHLSEYICSLEANGPQE